MANVIEHATLLAGTGVETEVGVHTRVMLPTMRLLGVAVARLVRFGFIVVDSF